MQMFIYTKTLICGSLLTAEFACRFLPSY